MTLFSFSWASPLSIENADSVFYAEESDQPQVEDLVPEESSQVYFTVPGQAEYFQPTQVGQDPLTPEESQQVTYVLNTENEDEELMVPQESQQVSYVVSEDLLPLATGGFIIF